MEEIWQCNCPICRFTVKPLLRIVGKKYNLQVPSNERTRHQNTSSNSKNIKELTEKYPVKTVKVAQQVQQSARIIQKESQNKQQNKQIMQQNIVQQQVTAPRPKEFSQTPSPKSKKESNEETKEEKQSKQMVKVEVPKEIIEKINSLETEVEKIKKYVKLSIDNIKATLVDLRSTLAELNNPFNILREYTNTFLDNEKEEMKKSRELYHIPCETNTSLQYVPIIIPTIPQQLATIAYNNSSTQHYNNVGINDINKSFKEEKETIGKESKEESIKTKPQISFEVYEKLVLWANDVLNKMERSTFTKLVDYYTDIGIITHDIGMALKKIVELVDELRKNGIDPKEQIKLLKDLISGIDRTRNYMAINREHNESYNKHNVKRTPKKVGKEELMQNKATKELPSPVKEGE